MSHKALVFVLSALICPSLRASAIVNTSLSLTSLTITPSLGGDSGSVLIEAGVFASVFAGVYNSNPGQSDLEDNFNFDGPTSISAAVSYATASASSDGSQLTESATSAVNLPSISAIAGTDNDGDGQLSGSLQIVDSTNATPQSVGVLFSAALTASQFLSTDANGVSAASEVTFQLILPDISGSPLLFYDNPLSIGTNQSLSSSSSPNQSSSVMLMTNTDYSFFIETDSESTGVSDSTPEPNATFLAAIVLAGMAIRRARRV